MKLIKLIPAALVLVFCFFFSSCETPAQKVDSAKVDVTEAEAELVKAHEEYKKDVEDYRVQVAQSVKENNEKIAELQNSIELVKKEVKEEYKIKITELQSQNRDMERKMAGYRLTTQEEWESFKTEFNYDMERLGEAIKDLSVKNN
jgi:predicted  nucleic acid-binding Zn-ribbon protein